MRLISASTLRPRILETADFLACNGIELAKRGKKDKSIDDAILELMLIYEFLPYWDDATVRQKECYVSEKFGA